ncbi:MAG: hypothetical protein HOJ89_04905 [Opitutales bacterium]|jgi:hypothetical protein|nr:hypothetical protein [Opitutales bacterium]
MIADHPGPSLSQSPCPYSGTIYLFLKTNSIEYPPCEIEVNESTDAGISAFTFTIPIIKEEGPLD